ncbi:MAG TPA: class E sortase [Acidimicrobiales bacterium]|nr:class E sortase [Acidimicrobiales bacterium]
MRLARVVGAVGRVLITVGVLVLAFVAYQLWGTGLQEARAQSQLEAEFEAALTPTTVPGTTTTTTTGPEPTTTTTTTAPPPVKGDAVARLQIPRIGVDKVVVEGVSLDDLKRGPGHFPGTPLPGELGNSAIAGHRTTYGAPFYDIGELEEGDEILVTTPRGEFRYLVSSVTVVRPDQVEVLDPSDDARLTLTTCHPRFSARQRLIVVATLDGEALEPATPPEAPTLPALPDDGPDGDDPDGDDPESDDEQEGDDPAGTGGDRVISGQVIGENAAAGLSGDPTARVPALLWGLAAATIWLAAWFVSTRWRRWPPYLLAFPFFAVALFLCFEQVGRLFPANI